MEKSAVAVENHYPQFRVKCAASGIKYVDIAFSVKSHFGYPCEHLPRLTLQDAYPIDFVELGFDKDALAWKFNDLLSLEGRASEAEDDPEDQSGKV